MQITDYDDFVSYYLGIFLLLSRTWSPGWDIRTDGVSLFKTHPYEEAATFFVLTGANRVRANFQAR
ncbi:hypothetical protein GCM10027185_27250 [Spirosoma pulveris]